MKTFELPGNIVIQADGEGKGRILQSPLPSYDPASMTEGACRGYGFLEGVLSVVLALAAEGYDLDTPKLQDAFQTAIDHWTNEYI